MKSIFNILLKLFGLEQDRDIQEPKEQTQEQSWANTQNFNHSCMNEENSYLPSINLTFSMTEGESSFEIKNDKDIPIVIVSPEVISNVEVVNREEAFRSEGNAISSSERMLLTLRMAFDSYIEMKRDIYAKSTIDKYIRIRNKRFQNIMDELVGELTEEKLQSAFDPEIEKGLSIHTLKGYRACVLNVLKSVRPDFHPEIKLSK